MKIKQVLAESFAYDFAEPYQIYEPEDFLAKIKEWAPDDFDDALMLATSGLEYEYPELHDQVCAILKPYALRYVLEIAKNQHIPRDWELDDYFHHYVDRILKELQPDWPELDHIVAVANKAFTHAKKTESVVEGTEESDELVAEFMGYIDQKNYPEAFNCLISAYDADRDCLQSWWSALDDEKPAIMKGLLHVIKNESDVPVESIIDDMYADLNWPELVTVKKALMYNKQQKAVPEAYDPDSDPVIGYVHGMYKDLSDGATDLTVLNLRDYIYDTGSPANLARSIQEIEPRLPALLEKNKPGIIKSMLAIVKQDYEYAGNVLFPVFEVLHHLGIKWPECDRITAALKHGSKNESVAESTEQIPAAEILKYVKHIHPEGEFNIDYVITDHPFWTEADVPVSSLHIFDPEQDDIYDPYNRVQDTDLYHVDRLIPNIAAIVQKKPLVIDDAGYILDGNHRALAAEKAGLQTVPVYRPVPGGVAEHIVKVKGGYELKSKKTGKNLGKYPTRAGAEKRERQVQYFKHAGESVAEAHANMFSAVMIHETTPELAKQILQNGFKPLFNGIFFNVQGQNYSGGTYGGVAIKAKITGPANAILDLENDEHLPADLDELADGEQIAEYARNKGYWAWTDGMQFAVLDPQHIQVQGINEDLTASNAPRVPAYIQSMEKKLSDNLRNLFQFVIDLAYEDRMSDPGFRSQVLAVFEKKKPELVKYMLHNIKHSDSDNVKWLAPAMIRMGLDWPELYTMHQALSVKKPDRQVSENNYRYSEVHKQKAESDARVISSSLEKIRKQIEADPKLSANDISRFWDVIHSIKLFSRYRLDILQPVLEHHKKTIVYVILYLMKHNEIYDTIDDIIDNLKYARINWPELKTLQQALAQGSKTESVSEAQPSEENPIRDQLNAWMNQDQQYHDPTQRKSFQAKVWPFIQKNMQAILTDKGPKGNGDYPAAPYAAWLLVQHMDAFPQNQVSFYNQLVKAIPNHPKIQFLKDRAAVNAWIQKNANNPEYYYKGKPLPDPTVNVRNPAMFKDAAVKAASREQALTNAEQAGNKLLVAAVKATNAQSQPSYTQQTESVEEADDQGKFKIISDMISRDYAEHPVRGFYMMLYHLNELELTVADMPEIKPLIDRVKPDVIRALLQSIKADNDGMNISNALQILDRMQNCGVDWPEIDKIRQGLQHGRQDTTEAFDVVSDRMQTFVRKMREALQNKLSWQIGAQLDEMARRISVGAVKFSDAQWQQAAAEIDLNNYKDLVIKGILENIKDEIEIGIRSAALAGNIVAQKQLLNKLGCDWPEIDRIITAVSHNAN